MRYFYFIIGTQELHSTLQPSSSQEWIGAPYTDIPRIPGLGIDVAHYRYANQGTERELHANGAVNSLGSDGFSLCSGLVLTDPQAKTITMAHLEPNSEAILDYLDRKPKDRIRRVALFYGSLSVRQSELEGLLSSGYFGQIQQTSAHFESGNTHWGMVFSSASNQVKVFTREPSQTIATFEL